jgi:predicted MPP superfamily phosphohydrolase
MIVLYICLAALAVWFFYWQDNDIVTTNISFANKKIPSVFEGFKILQVSDLHNKNFGKNQFRLIQKIKDLAPDTIVITGDLIDCHRPDVETAMVFIRQAVRIAPVYYVPGNQEARTDEYENLAGKLKAAGALLLENAGVRIGRYGETINLTGAQDIEFLKTGKKGKPLQAFKKRLDYLAPDEEGFTILLSHRPEYLNLYASENVDLVFSGHAHGGQVRLPFLGGLYAPGQGLLPKYTSGLYTQGDTSMIVSRGLGNSEFPLRVFNRPELILVTLAAGNEK